MREIRFAIGNHRYLHLRGSRQFGFQVWFNTANDYDGVLIARADDYESVLRRARKCLQDADAWLSRLEKETSEPPPTNSF